LVSSNAADSWARSGVLSLHRQRRGWLYSNLPGSPFSSASDLYGEAATQKPSSHPAQKKWDWTQTGRPAIL